MSLSSMLYSAGSGVKSVDVDLSGLSIRSFSLVQLKMESRYGWRLACATSTLQCEERVFMSSAYESIQMLAGGGGRSDIYRLKRHGDSTLP